MTEKISFNLVKSAQESGQGINAYRCSCSHRHDDMEGRVWFVPVFLDNGVPELATANDTAVTVLKTVLLEALMSASEPFQSHGFHKLHYCAFIGCCDGSSITNVHLSSFVLRSVLDLPCSFPPAPDLCLGVIRDRFRSFKCMWAFRGHTQLAAPFL
eukprot:1203080-Pleurochrysis_carterae.AAC.2